MNYSKCLLDIRNESERIRDKLRKLRDQLELSEQPVIGTDRLRWEKLVSSLEEDVCMLNK